MNKRFVLILVTTMTMSLLTSIQGNADTYNLTAFLSAVKQHNNDLKLVGKERDTAAVKAKDARSGALPSVGFNAGYNRNLTDYYMYFDSSALMPGSSGVIKAPFKRDNEFSSSIALQQTLFNPLVANAITAANQYRTMTDYVYNSGLDNIITGGKKLFYQCLLLEKVLGAAKSTETNAKENLDITKLKYDNGQTSHLECLFAETRWKNSMTETRKAERNLELAMNTLKMFAGIEADRDVLIEGVLDSIPEAPKVVSIESVLEKRPDYLALTWEERLRGTALKAAKNASLPTVTGTVAFSYTAQSDPFKLAEENKFWFAGVQMSVPLYTGGKIGANVQQTRIEMEKTTIRIEKTRQNISTELENIYLRIAEARTRIESAESTRNVAEEAFHIAETTTRDGLTTQLQLKDARVSFDQAVIGYYAAIYDYMAAYFDYELAVGKVK
jgi:outer membrane protein